MLRLIPGLIALLISFSYVNSQTYIDTIDFSSPSPEVVIDQLNPKNCWQIGQPAKNFLDSAYSDSRAIMTDTAIPYPPNSFSSFTLHFQLMGYQPTVSFFHRIHSTSGKDGGFVELSLDRGQSWIMLQDTSLNYPLPSISYGLSIWDLYRPTDSLPNGRIGLSGSDSGWTKTTILFPCMAIKTFWPAQLRFTFVSDSVAERNDGWIIDQFVIDNSGGCSSIPEKNQGNHFQIYPNPNNTERAVLKAREYHQHYTVKILGQSGVVVDLQEFSAGREIELVTGHIPSGHYLVLVTTESGFLGATQLIRS